MSVLPEDAAAVAWDIDGTLIDSEPLHHRALLAASRGFGVDLSDLPDMAFRGVHMQEVWALLRSRLPATLGRETWLDAIEAAYVAGADRLVAMPGAARTIHALAERGIAQVAVSNSSRRIVDANLAALGVARWIGFSISLDDVACGKPDPEPYAQATRRLDLPPGRVWAVEDSATGLASARAAGLRTIALNPSTEAPLNAETTIRRLSELLA